MKKRLLITCVTIIFGTTGIIIGLTSIIWLIIWLFSGFDIMSWWYRNLFKYPVEKYKLLDN